MKTCNQLSGVLTMKTALVFLSLAVGATTLADAPDQLAGLFDGGPATPWFPAEQTRIRGRLPQRWASGLLLTEEALFPLVVGHELGQDRIALQLRQAFGRFDFDRGGGLVRRCNGRRRYTGFFFSALVASAALPIRP